MIRNKLNLLLISLIYYFAILLVSGCEDKDSYSQSATPNPTTTNTFTPNPSPSKTTSSVANPTGLTSTSPANLTSPTSDLPKSNSSKVPKQNSTVPKTNQLTIQKSFLARKTTDGRVIPVNNANFKRGEDIYFVLVKVGKFKKNEEGKNWIDLDILLKNYQGKVLDSKQNMLGEKGNTLLNDDVAISPYGTVNTNKKMRPGKYKITLIVRDKISGAKLSTTKNLILQ